MRSNIFAAAIIAIGLIIGGFLAGGRYAMMNTNTNAVTRLDRYTGAVTMCVPGISQDSCGFLLDRPPSKSN